MTALLDASLAAQPDPWVRASEPESSDVQIVLDPATGDWIVTEWAFAVAAPFATLVDQVSWADVRDSWQGIPSGPFAGRPILTTPNGAAALTYLLGEPASGAIEVVADEAILERAWESRPSWAIIPFEQLEPRWKALRVDGLSLLDRELDLNAYPLVLRVGAHGNETGLTALRRALNTPLTNRDPQQMAVVMMTGVTALTRATAMRMDQHGPTYPGEDIRVWMVESDITHISSEVSFASDCPPQTSYTTLTFCSDPRYIELLEWLEVDIIELTGNHLLDWGVEAMELSLGMYDERALPYYGGGWNLTQAQTPVTMTVGATTFGFAGCNPAGPASDWATDTRPGSAPCDYERLYAQVREMRAQGIVPIVTLQYIESDQTEPLPQQRADFRALAEAGAAIVSGSQAHHPQGFEFYEGALIHYGLGNLFFDQMWSEGTRQEFLDRHVFYDGRHISTELLTAILEDYARPRPMTPEERARLLNATFTASEWD